MQFRFRCYRTPKSVPSRDGEPLTAERAVALAELARRDGRIKDAQRLERIARELTIDNCSGAQ
jgi:hypothetical protein